MTQAPRVTRHRVAACVLGVRGSRRPARRVAHRPDQDGRDFARGSSLAARLACGASHPRRFQLLELGSNHGASLQALIADPRCRRSSLSTGARRHRHTSDPRSAGFGNSRLEPGAPLGCTRSGFGEAGHHRRRRRRPGPAALSADLCFIDAQDTNAAALQAARFCRQVIRDRGVVVFHDRTLVGAGIQRFLGELSRYRAYPLAHDLFVVEINVPSLLADPRVDARVPRRAWLVAERLRAMRLFLGLSATVWSIRRRVGAILLALGAPRRSRRAGTGSGGVARAVRDLHVRQRRRAVRTDASVVHRRRLQSRCVRAADATAMTIPTPQLRASARNQPPDTRSSATRTCSPIRAQGPRSCWPP